MDVQIVKSCIENGIGDCSGAKIRCEGRLHLALLDKNGKYLIYCRTGIRSAKAMQLMRDKGFTNAHDLVGGYSAWTTAGLPVEK